MRTQILATLCLSIPLCAPASAKPADDEARFRTLFEQWQGVQHPRPNEASSAQGNARAQTAIRRSTVTSGMGIRVNPVLGRRMFHAGADLSASFGMIVRATADGTVAHAGNAGGYGLLVKLQHQYGYETRYAHMSRVLVVSGEHVRKGQIIGKVGSTGRSTGPHLHYEVRRYGRPMNPIPFMHR